MGPAMIPFEADKQLVLVGGAKMPVVRLTINATKHQRRASVVAKDVHIKPLVQEQRNLWLSCKIKQPNMSCVLFHFIPYTDFRCKETISDGVATVAACEITRLSLGN